MFPAADVTFRLKHKMPRTEIPSPRNHASRGHPTLHRGGLSFGRHADVKTESHPHSHRRRSAAKSHGVGFHPILCLCLLHFPEPGVTMIPKQGTAKPSQMKSSRVRSYLTGGLGGWKNKDIKPPPPPPPMKQGWGRRLRSNDRVLPGQTPPPTNRKAFHEGI